MTMPALQSGFTQEAFETFLASRREPEWLVELRREAWEIFADLPLPHMRQEEWRRTDLRLFRLDHFGPPGKGDGHLLCEAREGPFRQEVPVPFSEPGPASDFVPPALLAENVELGGRVITRDSRPFHANLDSKWQSRGVLFGSLDALAIEHGDLLRPYLESRIVYPGIDKFAALQAAFWCGGTLLYVPRGVVIDQPLHTLSAMTSEGVDLGRTLVVLEAGAEATLLAETANSDADAAGLHCGAIEIVVGPGARLRYVNLQNWGTGVWHFAHQKALVDRDARLQWTIGALGSRLAKVNQHVALVGDGAQTQVNGVMFTEGKQHLSYHTLQHHQAPHCKSDLLYRGALQDRSHLVWRGMIRVDRDAQKTDGYQRDDNLLLSETARVDSIPGLEILADDVKCTHGATAGRVDDELIFYAQARGLTRREAVRMVVTGFFQQVFDRITIESVRNALGDAIGRRVREYD